jgi:hypothetical protein
MENMPDDPVRSVQRRDRGRPRLRISRFCPIMPHVKRGRVSLAICAAMICAAACNAPDPPAPPAAETAPAPAEPAAAVASPGLRERTDPLLDPRLHFEQGGPLCDREDARDVTPFRDSVPEFAKEDLSVSPTFLCRLRAGRPEIRLTVMGDSAGYMDSVLVHSPASARHPHQALRLDISEPQPLGSDFLEGVDLNRDGWMDVKVMMFRGVTGNRIVDVFMFDPRRGRFVRDTVLSGQSHVNPLEGRPCVYTGWVFGHAGNLYSRAEYCWLNTRWVVALSESQVDTVIGPENESVYFRTTTRRRADGSYTSRLDTVRWDPNQ